MDWIKIFFILLATCIVIFIISKIWMGLVDTIISSIKKIFGKDKESAIDDWHSLEDIRKEDRERNRDSKSR